MIYTQNATKYEVLYQIAIFQAFVRSHDKHVPDNM
jgi:hypothetical protein